MNTKLTFIILLAAINIRLSPAQTGTQRLVLAEDFTSVNCPPSVFADSVFHTLLSANTSKVTRLCYPWLFGNNDPMYIQNSSQLMVRKNYYGVYQIPYALMNGSIATVSSPSYPGSPYNWTQAKIDSAWAVPSPFSIMLTHTINYTLDSIFITATITAAQNISMVNPKFRCAITEEHIHFATAPGSNGETDFYNIVRRMYPDASGTVLSASWVSGQSQIISFAQKLPTYIYDISQVAVVAFIQDDQTGTVHQAAYSAPITNVSVSELARVNEVGIYPNPFSESATVVINSTARINDPELILFDLTGKLAEQIVIREQKSIITRGNLLPGVYIYKLTKGNEIIGTGKVVIQ